MARTSEFTVVIGTDGSAASRAAVAVAASFPWPRGTRLHGVLARGELTKVLAPAAQLELGRALERVAAQARRVLARRSPEAEVVFVDAPPAEGILGEARRLRAAAIVVGARGLGALSRLLLGSVSRAVVREATSAVLVVKGRPRAVRRILIGLDGSESARRTVAFVARLAPPAGGRVVLVHVLDPVRAPSMGLMPGSVRAALGASAASLEAERRAAARREIAAARRTLESAGWTVAARMPVGIPRVELLAAARATGAHTLAVGARGTGGMERLLLGSVAEGTLDRATVPVLMVK
ncbi:MAG: universal stress protein [Candidatus Rokubacteria bacterium]|nr:universal stress protein [Candidatus Rokubacteria bacterium]